MHQNTAYVKKIYTIIYFVFLAITILYTVFFTDFFSPGAKKRVLDFSDGWTISTGEELSIAQIKRRRYAETVTLEKKLPDDIGDMDSFCFQSKNVNVVAWIDDEEVYRFETKDNITGAGYGFVPHEIGLNEQMRGSVIRISYDGVIDGYAGGGLIGICICSGSDYIRITTLDNLLLISVSLLVLFIGAVLVILWIIMPNRAMFPFDILAFGAMSFVLGLWSAIDTGLPMLFSGHIYASRIITRFLLPMFFYPFFCFLHSFTEKKRPIYRHIAFWSIIFYNPILIFLRFSIDKDMIYTYAYGFFVLGIILIITIAIMMIDDIYSCSSKGNKSRLLELFGGFLIIVVGGVIESIFYFLRINPTGRYFVYLRLGIFGFIISVFILFLKWWIVDRASVEREESVNRSLRFSMESDSPEQSISRLIEYMGVQYHIRRVCLLEDAGDGNYKESYEWCRNIMDRHRTDSLIIPLDVLEKNTDDKHQCMTIKNRKQYEETFPKIVEAMDQVDINCIISGRICFDGAVAGVLELQDPPEDRLSEIEDIIGELSFFFEQMMKQRKYRDDILYYSYHDELTGSKNHICYRDYTERKLDLSQPFGYLISKAEYTGNGDAILKSMAQKLIDVFGENNVYRIEENKFVAFGFETDETFFRNDVTRAKLGIIDGQCSYHFGALYCANGTRSLDVIKVKALELMGEKVDIKAGSEK